MESILLFIVSGWDASLPLGAPTGIACPIPYKNTDVYKRQKLYRSLDANLAFLEERFGRSDDFYTKRLMIAGIPCAVVMFTGLSSPEKLCRMALDMLDRDPAMLGGGEGLCVYLLTQSRIPAEPDAVEDTTALVELLTNGLSILLIDGVRKAVDVYKRQGLQSADRY